MSQVDELLNNLSEEEVAAYTANPATEPHIVINEDRSITVPNELKNIAVQFDNNIETVTFDCPRYWDGHDLSLMTLYINYKRPDNKLGTYLAKNKSISSDDANVMHFEWTLDRDVTAVKGTLSILVCAQQVDADGLELYHWNSQLNQDLNVLEGMDCETTVLDQYPAIITDLLNRMSTVENIPPVVEVETDEDGIPWITITDINGTNTFKVPQGPRGPKGEIGDVINLATGGVIKIFIGTAESWKAYDGDKTDVLVFDVNDTTVADILKTLKSTNGVAFTQNPKGEVIVVNVENSNIIMSPRFDVVSVTDYESELGILEKRKKCVLRTYPSEILMLPNTYGVIEYNGKYYYYTFHNSNNSFYDFTIICFPDSDLAKLSEDDVITAKIYGEAIFHKAACDVNGDYIPDTYLKKEDAENIYAKKNPEQIEIGNPLDGTKTVITKPGLYSFAVELEIAVEDGTRPGTLLTGTISITDLTKRHSAYIRYGVSGGTYGDCSCAVGFVPANPGFVDDVATLEVNIVSETTPVPHRGKLVDVRLIMEY